MSSEPFHVGQTVMLRDVNDRGRAPREVTVTKVGRKLVYVEHYGRSRAFRIDTGAANDDYGHASIETQEQATQRQRRAAALDVLRDHYLKPDYGFSLPTETIEQIAEILAPGNPDKDGQR